MRRDQFTGDRKHLAAEHRGGARARPGDALLLIEAMKTEIAVQADRAGTIIELRCQRGQTVAAGDTLIGFDPDRQPMNSSMPCSVRSLGIADLAAAYRERRTSPVELVRELFARIAALNEGGIWISMVPEKTALHRRNPLAPADPDSLPLYGIPFAIKDNIDLAGLQTTAACPAFAYTPEHSAHVVTRLMQAGAIPIGKTNLDQFATGLVGTRSPYGVCRNSINPAYISGGSSSGSAVAVAKGLASFALGTDTAGSGRIPAAFNNILGLKPPAVV